MDTEALIDENYVFRIAVEPAAILAPSFALNSALTKECRRRHELVLSAAPETVSRATLSDIDTAFHRMIGISSGNRFYVATIERHIALARIIRHASKWDVLLSLEGCMDHLEILALIERNEREEAAELMRNHLVAARSCNPQLPHQLPKSSCV